LKHPALTRIFSLVLAVLCLTMLLAGLGVLRSAIKGNARSLADWQRLTDRIEEYRQIHDALLGSASYQEANEALQEEQAQHDEEASQHRIDLAIYTATRGGIQSGAAALDQAESAFWAGKAQYQEGIALFEEQEKAFWEGYEQFQEGKKQLAEARKTLELSESALRAMRAQLNASRNLAAILESDDPNARQQLTVAAYDTMLQTLDSMMQLYDMLESQDGISPEQMQMVAQLLAQESGTEIGELLEDVNWQGISGESLRELESVVTASTGMSVEQIRALIQQRRDEAAAMDADGAISEEQFAAMQQAYAQSRDLILQVDNAMEAKLSEYEAELAETRAQLDAAQAQVDAMEPILEQGKIAIEQARAALDMAGDQMQTGEQALAEGRRQLQEQQDQLKEKEEQLRREKEELDQQASDLADKGLAVASRQELEQRETSVRLMLLERDGIRERVDQGMELLPAADDYAAVYQREIDRTFDGLLWIASLMVLGGIAGFVGIPAAFEKNKSRFWLIAPVVGVLFLAAAAELLCRLQGRGDSYSALAAAIFALIQLALVIPTKKKA
jgi:putative ABC transport system permease protein